MKTEFIIKKCSHGKCGYCYFPKELIGHKIKIKVMKDETNN